MSSTKVSLTARMFIPETLSGSARDCLTLIRSTVQARTEAAAIPDEDTAKKMRDSALKTFRTAYGAVTLTEVQRKALLTATGMRHAQVTQFTREDMVSILETMRGWFPRATKATAKVSSTELVREVKGALMDTEVTVLQSIVAEAAHGDKIVIVVNKDGERDGATVAWDRGGKKAHAYYDAANNTLKEKTLAHNRDINSSAMADGRARRIARELTRPGGGVDKLGKGDVTWMQKGENAKRVQAHVKALAG